MKISILILLLLMAIKGSVAQTPDKELSLAPVKANICVAIGTKKSRGEIKILIPKNSPKIIKWVINWGDKKPKEEIPVSFPTSDMDIEDVRGHDFELGNCLNKERFTVEVTATYAPDLNLADFPFPGYVFFTNPPTATIKANQERACIGQEVRYNIQLCPQDGVRSRIAYGDGSSEEIKANHDYRHVFTTKGTFNGTLYLENSCNEGNPTEIPFTTTIIERATAMILDSGSVGNAPALVCLSNGRAVVRLDGRESPNASLYYWSGTGFRFVSNTNGNMAQPYIEFFAVGTFQVILQVDNACGQRSAPVTKTYKVSAAPQVSLPLYTDQCKPFLFKIDNPLAGVEYTLNGQPIPIEGIIIGYSEQPYVVKATATNECTGGVPVTITQEFYVRSVEPVKILSNRDTTLCVGGSDLTFTTNVTGGSWFRNGLPFNGTFSPSEKGKFWIAYAKGTGTCQSRDSVLVRVVGTEVKANDVTVCEQATYVVLSASIPKGVWSCAGCIFKGDTLFLSGITANQVQVLYRVRGADNGCEATATATVTIQRPLIVNLKIPNACLGKAIPVEVTVTGTTQYRWYLDGSSVPFSTETRPALNLSAGTHTIRLVVGNDNCSDTGSINVTITSPPQPTSVSVQLIPANGCGPVNVSLRNNQPKRDDLKYLWQQNGRTIATTYELPTTTLTNSTTNSQSYVFTLLQFNDCDTTRITETIVVKGKILARLGIDNTNYRCSPATITATDNSPVRSDNRYLIVDGQQIPLTDNRRSFQLAAKNNQVTTYVIKLVAVGDCNTSEDSVTVRVFPQKINPLFNMTATSVCIGQRLRVTDVTPSGEFGTVLFKFSDGQQFAGRNVERTFDRSGTYSVRLIVKLGCVIDSLTRSFEVKVPPKPTGVKLLTPTVCQGQSVLLSYSGSYAFLYAPEGLPHDSVRFSPSFVFTTSGVKNIRFTVFDEQRSCFTDTLLRVTVRPAPKIREIITPAVACDESTIQVEIVTDGQVTNYTTTFLKDSQTFTFQSQSFTASLKAGVYDALVKVSDGKCSDSTLFFGALKIDPCLIGIPDNFSPNGDGVSENFTIFGNDKIFKILFLKVFDQWGNVLYLEENMPLNDLSHGWDGKNLNNVEMPEGVYPWQAEIQQADEVVKKIGVVRLVR